MRLPEAYRCLARPSSATEPSHPPGGVVTACSRRLQHSSGFAYDLTIIGTFILTVRRQTYAIFPGLNLQDRVHYLPEIAKLLQLVNYKDLSGEKGGI